MWWREHVAEIIFAIYLIGLVTFWVGYLMGLWSL